MSSFCVLKQEYSQKTLEPNGFGNGVVVDYRIQFEIRSPAGLPTGLPNDASFENVARLELSKNLAGVIWDYIQEKRRKLG